ncbi:terpenoid cyclases/protein prenyltransferase alpha-alpha toroid [Blastocladiella britannica]|nr:terpenoid cyclases/protein prenyltransferase alpha-alpha toroid [Blastocladiella britannica]
MKGRRPTRYSQGSVVCGIEPTLRNRVSALYSGSLSFPQPSADIHIRKMTALRFPNTVALTAHLLDDEKYATESSIAQEGIEDDIYSLYHQALIDVATAAQLEKAKAAAGGAEEPRSYTPDGGDAHLGAQGEVSATDGSRATAAAKSPLTFQRKRHAAYLSRCIAALPPAMTALSASRPWIVFWLLHAADLVSVGEPLSDVLRLRAASTLLRFQHRELGGFGGGIGQLPHLAATYAAIHALAMCRDKQVWASVDRRGIYHFLMRCKQPDGSFRMHEAGEVDIRGSYCVLSVARMLDILTPELADGCMDFIVRCQSHDGGLASVPHLEAHGGYTFCGLAAALLLGEPHRLDLDALLGWTIRRQMPMEGGFQGRPNKLVDACYSWWCGAVFSLLDAAFLVRESTKRGGVTPAHAGLGSSPLSASIISRPSEAWDRVALQEYLLIAAQHENRGGMRDKPGKNSDAYHTCYALSGLSAAQHVFDVNFGPKGWGDVLFSTQDDAEVTVVGSMDNLLHSTDPIHNIRFDALDAAKEFFSSQPIVLEAHAPTVEESA